MRRLLLEFIGALVLAIAVPEASATIIQQLTIEEMTDRADAIVLGRHLESESMWVGRMLVTRVTVAVSELLKGETQPMVTVEILGGVDRNRKVPIAMTVPGAPRIHSGERVILFLSRIAAPAGAGEYEIVGFSQGKLSVVEDAQGRQVIARGAVPGAPKPLADFKAQIQRRLARQGIRSEPSVAPGLEKE